MNSLMLHLSNVEPIPQRPLFYSKHYIFVVSLMLKFKPIEATVVIIQKLIKWFYSVNQWTDVYMVATLFLFICVKKVSASKNILVRSHETFLV